LVMAHSNPRQRMPMRQPQTKKPPEGGF